MKKKALFLLTVFLLNMLVGFSCALHRDTDHEKIHEGEPNAGSYEHHSGEHYLSENHSGGQNKVSTVDAASFLPQDSPCCQDSMNKFSSLAKDTPRQHPNIKPLTFPLPNQHYFYDRPLFENSPWSSNSLVVKERPPTISLRIVIQSFQI
jgi:hypothetical protein